MLLLPELVALQPALLLPVVAFLLLVVSPWREVPSILASRVILMLLLTWQLLQVACLAWAQWAAQEETLLVKVELQVALQVDVVDLNNRSKEEYSLDSKVVPPPDLGLEGQGLRSVLWPVVE